MLLLALVFWSGVEKRLDAYNNEIDLWHEVLRIHPNDSLAHSVLGEILISTSGGLPDAITELQAAVKLNPKNTVALNALGVAASRARAGRRKRSRRELEATLAQVLRRARRPLRTWRLPSR